MNKRAKLVWKSFIRNNANTPAVDRWVIKSLLNGEITKENIYGWIRTTPQKNAFLSDVYGKNEYEIRDAILLLDINSTIEFNEIINGVNEFQQFTIPLSMYAISWMKPSLPTHSLSKNYLNFWVRHSLRLHTWFVYLW